MEYRKIATGMIESTYENYVQWREDGVLDEELNKHNQEIPVWDEMNESTKCSAIEYVYLNRDTIELHSGLVESWVQATAYFMIYDFAAILAYDGKPEIEVFFDDMDFMMDQDILDDEDVQEQLGISPDFGGKF
jgi:hypothetical protein